MLRKVKSCDLCKILLNLSEHFSIVMNYDIEVMCALDVTRKLQLMRGDILNSQKQKIVIPNQIGSNEMGK